MQINGNTWQTIWLEEDKLIVRVIDQTKLPHSLEIKKISSCIEAYYAIKNMVVRGAPLIGVTGAYGFALAVNEDPSDLALKKSFDLLKSARPTAVNLEWGLKRILSKIKNINENDRFRLAIEEAKKIELEDISICSAIGEHGKELIKKILKQKSKNDQKEPLNILTHCNAGWLATVDWGTALAPIYKAHKEGIDLHVWVDETRPRNQGSSLTAFELDGEGISNTVIVDNAGGHLMQNNKVDLVIVGSDRTTNSGDVCNKIGTYLKALAAKDCGVPFYVALPTSTIDWDISNGIKEINIENRSSEEITNIKGITKSGKLETVRITSENCRTENPGFDITPARLVTALITEKGVFAPNFNSLKQLK